MRLRSGKPLACPECGCTDRLESSETMALNYALAVDAEDPAEFDYTGDSRDFHDSSENTAPRGHMDFWCRACDHEWRDALAGQDPGPDPEALRAFGAKVLASMEATNRGYGSEIWRIVSRLAIDAGLATTNDEDADFQRTAPYRPKTEGGAS